MNHCENAIDMVLKNWKLALFLGILTFFIPELTSFAEPSKDFSAIINYLDPIYRLLGLALITYAAFFKQKSSS